MQPFTPALVYIMAAAQLPAWKKAPALRLFIPLMAGIICQKETGSAPFYWLILLSLTLLISTLFYFFSTYSRFRSGWFIGACIHLMLIATGGLLLTQHDLQYRKHDWNKIYNEGDGLIVTLDEAPRERTNSYAATASVQYVIQAELKKAVDGSLLLYFQKDSAGSVAAPGPVRPGGGSFLLISKKVQLIRSSGNPGGFDFGQYMYRKGFVRQVFLQPTDYIVLPAVQKQLITEWTGQLRESILRIFRSTIKVEKDRGLAEALLIGYKDELDKELVRSYSNTGVVHIIAISGLHLGLIYGLLVLLCRPLQKIRWLRALLIIAALWAFSILAGAQPSVLRSALMFSCIVIGEYLDRRGTAINSLVFSAFLLLCINPWWLWDAGFQLSYAAVLSIMLYQRPIYNLLYIRNKLSDFIWQLNSVTLAAQLLTVPVTLYWFHQFPVYFMLTNLIAVPLSSLIVLTEIVLMVVSGIPLLAVWTGQLIAGMIRLMNTWIINIERMPFSSWTGLQISFAQSILLFLTIIFLAGWLMERQTRQLQAALVATLLFCSMRSFSFFHAQQQRMIVVYNTPGKQTAEVIQGRMARYYGDDLSADSSGSWNNVLVPAHTMFRVRQFLTRETGGNSFGITWNGTSKILILSRKNVFLPEVPGVILVVADGTLSGKGLQRIQAQCEEKGIRFYSVREQGAFVMTLP